jgi:hypothetical protein
MIRAIAHLLREKDHAQSKSWSVIPIQFERMVLSSIFRSNWFDLIEKNMLQLENRGRFLFDGVNPPRRKALHSIAHKSASAHDALCF